MTEENAEALEDAVVENAQGPKRAKGDMGEVENHSLKDQIAAAQFAAAQTARKRKRTVRLIRCIPPGTTC